MSDQISGGETVVIRKMSEGEEEEGNEDDYDDAYFGLSDAQIDSLWQRLDEKVSSIAMDDGDDDENGFGQFYQHASSFSLARRVSEAFSKRLSNVSCDSADFGLSDKQLDELTASLQSGRKVTSDEIEEIVNLERKKELQERLAEVEEAESPEELQEGSRDKATGGYDAQPAAVNDAPPKSAPSKPPVKKVQHMQTLEDFLNEDPVFSQVEKRSAHTEDAGFGSWSVNVVSTRDIRGESWYLLRVNSNSQSKLCMKPHREIVQLDEALRWVTAGRDNVTIPMIPTASSGTVTAGLMGWLGADDNAKQRQIELQSYWNGVTMQLPPPNDEPLLGDFFGLS